MRISELTELAESPASSDEFVIVDKSDTTQSTSGTTKRIQSQYVTIADASTTVKGKVELATDAETITGTDTARAVTPSNITAAAPTFIPSTVHAATGKTTPVDADELGLVDSAASYVLKKLTWANIKATLLTWLRLSTTIIPTNAPQGFLINGKISVTDTGSGLTVAIKTLSGTDPSSTNPVYCRIGDTVRTISAALSVTLADGTSWMNLGSAELATKEADLPVFLGYNATDGVVIGFSRVWGEQYSDWSTTSTNEKYLAVSNRSNASATDYYECIGRFAATITATNTVSSYSESNYVEDTNIYTGSITSAGQLFTCTSADTLTSCKFYLSKNGSPTGNAVAKLYAVTGTLGVDAKPTGSALATSDNLDVSTLGTGKALTTLTFSGANQYAMSASTVYAIVLEYTGGSGSNYVKIGVDSSAPAHAGNGAYYQSSSWNYYANDYCFYVYGCTYTWSVPTYTAKNLIQRPIYESRDTSSTGTTTGFSSGPTVNVSNYRIKNGTCKYHYEGSLSGTSNATSYTIALPFSGKSGEINYFLIPEVKDNGSFQTTPGLGLIASGGTVITLYKNCVEAGWTASGQKGIASLDIEYKI